MDFGVFLRRNSKNGGIKYDAYTLPTYDEKSKYLIRVKIDMDDDFRREYETDCELEELEDEDNFEEIKKFYGIGALDKLIDEIMQSSNHIQY